MIGVVLLGSTFVYKIKKKLWIVLLGLNIFVYILRYNLYKNQLKPVSVTKSKTQFLYKGHISTDFDTFNMTKY